MDVQDEVLDQDSVEPLYAQLIDRFRRMIQSEELRPGDRFPAELDLARDYGVARITVRRAISELVREGLLVRARGKGSFVAEPKIERELVNVASFTERMRVRGQRAGAQVLGVAVIPASSTVAQALALAEGEPVVEVRRLRTSNAQPLALETSYLSLQRCPGMDQVDLRERSLYETLAERYGLRPVGSRRTLELTFATVEESRLLQVAPRAPLFLMTAAVSATDGAMMEYAKILYRGDRFRFQL